MLHHNLASYERPRSAHYAVAESADTSVVLVQLQDERGDQVRVRLTEAEALSMAALLREKAELIHESDPEPSQYCARDGKKVHGCDGKRTDACLGCVPSAYIMDWSHDSHEDSTEGNRP